MSLKYSIINSSIKSTSTSISIKSTGVSTFTSSMCTFATTFATSTSSNVFLECCLGRRGNVYF